MQNSQQLLKTNLLATLIQISVFWIFAHLIPVYIDYRPVLNRIYDKVCECDDDSMIVSIFSRVFNKFS